jgi:Spy/CpxP family protein refolding chaperone
MAGALLLTIGSVASAQQNPGGDLYAMQQGPPPPGPGGDAMPGPFRAGRPGDAGRWWENPETARQIGLSQQQQEKVHAVLQSHRARLFELSQRVQQEDFAMDGLMNADQLDENAVIAQSGRVADARAELEKYRVRMLVELRGILTLDQWHKLQALRPEPGPLSGPGGPQRR